MVKYFKVVKVSKTSDTLDVTLEERDNGVDGYLSGQLRQNGFYEESILRDYPVRGRKMSFLIKRWVEIGTGKSVSRRWNLFAEGTRLSKEFAAFFKICLDRYPITGRSFEWFFDIDGDLFERQAPSERLQAVEGLCRGSSRREMAGVPAEHRTASATFMPKHRLFTMHHIWHRFGV